jgi:hypothetical protein
LRILFFFVFLIVFTSSSAHPGWGIAVDSKGVIYFTDIVNRTIWKLEPGEKPEALPLFLTYGRIRFILMKMMYCILRQKKWKWGMVG